MMSKKIRILIAVLIAAVVLYGLDYLSARLGIPARPRFATYTITRLYRINEKFNKFSFETMPSVQERCVNALFPHSGSRPCWYVQRHTTEIVELN